jgi:hypothetical protein
VRDMLDELYRRASEPEQSTLMFDNIDRTLGRF